MIRINLLAVDRERAKTRTLIPAAQRTTLVASAILLVTAISIGWWFWSLRQTSLQLDADLQQAERETQQLRSVLAQVQKFEARKAQLQQRVSLIEQLRKGQSVPVHLLDEISKSLPDRLWLTDMQQGGQEFTVKGITTSMTAVSDFIANLEGTKWFKRPVEIVDSQVQADPKTGDMIRFEIKAVSQDPTAPSAAPAKPTGTPGITAGPAPR